jgi:hypothetical protein
MNIKVTSEDDSQAEGEVNVVVNDENSALENSALDTTNGILAENDDISVASEPINDEPILSQAPNHHANIDFVAGAPPPNHQPTPVEPKSGSKKLLVAAVISILMLAGLSGTTYYFYNQNRETIQAVLAAQSEIKWLSSTEETTVDPQQKLLADIGTLTALPTGETPSIATIDDPIKAKTQPFLKNAQKGDKVLVYAKAQKAYLYRPSTDTIINIATVKIEDSKSPTGTTDNTNQ